MWRAGQLPVPAEQLPTGTILVNEVKAAADGVGLHTPVSSSDQRREGEAQWGCLVVPARQQGWTVMDAVFEIGPA